MVFSLLVTIPFSHQPMAVKTGSCTMRMIKPDRAAEVSVLPGHRNLPGIKMDHLTLVFLLKRELEYYILQERNNQILNQRRE